MTMSVTLDEKLLAKAKELTQIDDTQQLIRYSIESMMSYEAVKCLVKLAGIKPSLKVPPRRRWEVED